MSSSRTRVESAEDWRAAALRAGEAQIRNLQRAFNHAGIMGALAANDRTVGRRILARLRGKSNRTCFLGMRTVLTGMLGEAAASIGKFSSVAGLVGIYGGAQTGHVAASFAVRS